MAKKKQPPKKKPAGKKPVPKGYVKKGKTVINKSFVANVGKTRHHELALKSAQSLWNRGVRSGEVWRGIIDVLGYDPRKKNKLEFQTQVTPGAAAVPAPAINPFRTPEDEFAAIDFEGDIAGQLSDIDFNLDNLRIGNEFQKAELTRQHGENVEQTNDQAIGRGLFQSSIRDAELNDLEASKRVRSNFLDTNFSLAQSQAGLQKNRLTDALNKFRDAMRRKEVQNAAEIASTSPVNVKEATKPKIVRTVKKTPVLKPPKPRFVKPKSVGQRRQKPGGGIKRPAKPRKPRRRRR